MRFLYMVKGAEGQGMPPAAMIEAVEQSAAEATKNGTLVARGGLYPAASGFRARVDNGKVNITDGPYAEAKEVIGGFAIFELKSRDEAIEAAKSFMELHRKHWPGWVGEVEVRHLFDGAPDFTQFAKK